MDVLFLLSFFSPFDFLDSIKSIALQLSPFHAWCRILTKATS